MALSSDNITSEQSEPPGKNDDDADVFTIYLKLYPDLLVYKTNNMPLYNSDNEFAAYKPGGLDVLTKEEKSARTGAELLKRDLHWIFEAHTDAFLVGSLAYTPITNPDRVLDNLDADIVCLSHETQNRIDFGLKVRGYSHKFNGLGGHRYIRGENHVDLWTENSIHSLYDKVRAFPKGVGFIWRPYQTWYVEPTKWKEYPNLLESI